MRRVDAFLLNNELDILEFRLNVLDPVMDAFVVVESTVEFSGRPKPLYFSAEEARFAKWGDKIRHVVVDDTPDSGANRWAREHHQRNAMIRGIREFKPDDLVFMSDVDEIPDPDVVRLNKVGGYQQVYSMYYANTVCEAERWVGTLALLQPQFRQLGMQRARDDRYRFQRIHPGGWHFAYMMSTGQMHEKLRAFAHSEHDNRTIHNILEQRVSGLRDLFGAHNEPLQVADVETGYFPEHLKNNRAEYLKWILPSPRTT